MRDAPILHVRDLSVSTAQGGAPDLLAVRGLTLDIYRGETLALVGESGCGKSLTALAIMRLLPQQTVRISSGQVEFNGADLTHLSEAQMRRIRGRQIGMIFQEPMSALNPVLTIGEQIGEALRSHGHWENAALTKRCVELLEQVRVPNAKQRLSSYAHELSGGTLQRIVIASAIANKPLLLLADEPTTALDVTIQREILDLLKDIQREMGLAILFITHDLGVVAEISDRVAVMYAGRKVEEKRTQDLFERPGLPYTSGLLSATLDVSAYKGDRARLKEIPGRVPALHDVDSLACAFADRCQLCFDPCRAQVPALKAVGTEAWVACHAR